MTDLRDLVRGDNRSIEFSVIDFVTEAPVDITDAVIKFAAKSDPNKRNDKGELFKTTYDAADVLITDPVGGVYLVRLYHGDTRALPAGVLCWDTQITRKGALQTAAGTISVDVVDIANGRAVLTTAGVDFSAFRVGDVLEPAGGSAENSVRCTIEDVDEDAGTIETDYVGWSTEAGFAFAIYEGDVDTPIDGSGEIKILAGVTK